MEFKTPHIIGIKNMSEECIQNILNIAFKMKQNLKFRSHRRNRSEVE
ncbi:MAG: hypothetical protein ACW98X_23715 [Promethearchaeota archaeon]